MRFRRALDAQLEESRDGEPSRERSRRLTRRHVRGAIHLPGKATSVIGMRRAGKTTFLQQLRAERLARGVPLRRLPMLRLEDERFDGLDGGSLGRLIDEYPERYLADEEHRPDAWFLDEIQVVPGWQRLVRRLLDSGQVEIFLSGSSAALLSREIATELRGRAWKVLIHPFSLDEALRHSGVTAHANADLETALGVWLKTGGFPEAQGVPAATRIQLLRDYVDVAILRDVVDRHGVQNVTGLRWLARQLLANAASPFSVEKFHRRLKSQGIAIGRDTVHDLLGHLEDCFLIRTVWMEADSERQRMVNPRKAYPVDAGLIPAFDRTGRANVGHALETAVLIELERRRCEITYVRTREGYEVDFLARPPDGDAELIQVCADASSPNTASREIRSLLAAAERHPAARKRLITLTQTGLPEDVPPDIDAQPAHEWLLEGSRPGTEPPPPGWR